MRCGKIIFKKIKKWENFGEKNKILQKIRGKFLNLFLKIAKKFF